MDKYEPILNAMNNIEKIINKAKEISSLNDEPKYYHISWLEDAIRNFYKDNTRMKVIRADMTFGEFIEKYVDMNSINVK